MVGLHLCSLDLFNGISTLVSTIFILASSIESRQSDCHELKHASPL